VEKQHSRLDQPKMDPRYLGHGGSQHQEQAQSERGHQRFSWQPPLEEEAPTYRQPPQHHQIPQANNNTHNRAFSYAQTPIEHRGPSYTSAQYAPPLPTSPQSPTTPIDLRPQSTYYPYNEVAQFQPQQAYISAPPNMNERTPISPISPYASTHAQSFSPVSPLVDPRQHSRQLSNLAPINTNVGQYNPAPVPPAEASPLPDKTPVAPYSPDSIKHLVDSRAQNGPIRSPTEPYTPHGFPTSPSHAVFSPHSAHGPNGFDSTLHQPGQTVHPNMDLAEQGTAHTWKHSLLSCSGDASTCLTGLACPCILYGRTSYRLSQKSAKKDPTDMLGHSSTNGHCMLMGLSCGLWWLFPAFQRTRIRHAYKLGGSVLGDLARGCCCCCCVAVQNEREVRQREASARRWAGPASVDVYKRTELMAYKAQR
jgi:Cys-rich protein (TIGR01571 family)